MKRQDFLKAALVLCAIPAFAKLSVVSSHEDAIKKLARIIDKSSAVSVNRLNFSIVPNSTVRMTDVQYIFNSLKPSVVDLVSTTSLNKFSNNVDISEIIVKFANKNSMEKIMSELLPYMESKNVKRYISRLIF